MQNSQDQWLAIILGQSHIVVSNKDVAFLTPIADLEKCDEMSTTATLHYGGKQFTAYRLNENLDVQDGAASEGRFCVCLSSSTCAPFVLIADGLVKTPLAANVKLEPLPELMRGSGNPITHVAVGTSQLLLFSSASKLHEHIQTQIALRHQSVPLRNTALAG